MDIINLVKMEKTKMEETKCPTCGASLKKYWHKITPGLVKALAKAYREVSTKGENRFDKHDLQLSHSEYGNFQKLRFHGLIAKYLVEGVWKKGEWLITRRGSEFLKGYISIPVRVQTWRNRVVDHDTELVDLKDVVGTDPYFETEFDFSLFEPVQEKLL